MMEQNERKEALKSLERIIKPFLAGAAASAAVVAVECLYVLPQKPLWTGREAAGMLAASLVPLFVGAMPLLYESIKCTYEDIRKNGLMPRGIR